MTGLVLKALFDIFTTIPLWQQYVYTVVAAVIAGFIVLSLNKPESLEPLSAGSAAEQQDDRGEDDSGDPDSTVSEDEDQLELKRRRKAMEALYNVSLATSSLLDVDELLEYIVDLSLRVIGAKQGSIMLTDKHTNTMLIRTAVGIDPEIVEKARVKVGEGISGWVAHTGEPLLIKDLERDKRFSRGSEEKYDTKYETQSLISCPLKVKDDIIGVININNKLTGESFDKYDLELLTILANYAAVAIETAQLHENINNHYVNIIGLATRALEAKDPYTLGHSERVTQYGVDIAERMQLPRDDIRIIRQAGILHDIGKIGISESILLKKGRLTDDEFEKIKRHPIIGSTIIEPMNVLPGVRDAILYHHERFDGYGYPEGLKEEAIPLSARILCVADSFDAMTSTRPYRPALPSHVVIKELKKNKGKQFDPIALDVFLKILQERKYYVEEPDQEKAEEPTSKQEKGKEPPIDKKDAEKQEK